ncbi:glycosyltransferase [Gibbsiella quercinecans]|uniref:glycosyltransferase n=1 Tax=Gibbsiella quercinecans TaxID=929813 RepID=UPI003A4DFEAD
MNVNIFVPVYNGGALWEKSALLIKENISKDLINSVMVIDSSSSDNSVDIAKSNGFDVRVIPSSQFNHGGTRNLILKLSPDSDIVIFLTQDSLLQKHALENILSVFSDENVAAAYGRQLPHDEANPLARHARFFNYKMENYKGDLSTKDSLGLKTVFMSNSFSAYRISILKELGAFPENTILCEDMFFSAKAVLAGYKIAYVADAEVKHSHNYSAIEEFKRYFDIGVFHYDEPWIRKSFGGAGGEGKKFILSELKYLLKHAPLWILIACVNNFAKILGYKLGQNYTKLSPKWRRKLSMHKRYWDSISN